VALEKIWDHEDLIVGRNRGWLLDTNNAQSQRGNGVFSGVFRFFLEFFSNFWECRGGKGGIRKKNAKCLAQSELTRGW
jgi:malate synthase